MCHTSKIFVDMIDEVCDIVVNIVLESCSFGIL